MNANEKWGAYECIIELRVTDIRADTLARWSRSYVHLWSPVLRPVGVRVWMEIKEKRWPSRPFYGVTQLALPFAVFLKYVKVVGPGTVCVPGPTIEGCCGGVLLSHTLPGAVPSALAGLASRFGMDAGRFPAAMTTTRWFNQYSLCPPLLFWGGLCWL